MPCYHSENTIICTGKIEGSARRIFRCRSCRKRRRFRVDFFEWYGARFYCCHCGNVWSDGELRRSRKKQKEKYKLYARKI